MPKRNPAVLTQVTVSLPFGIGSASWEADPTERNAAWELYVELVTRVAVQSLNPQEGLVREAMNSLLSERWMPIFGNPNLSRFCYVRIIQLQSFDSRSAGSRLALRI